MSVCYGRTPRELMTVAVTHTDERVPGAPGVPTIPQTPLETFSHSDSHPCVGGQIAAPPLPYTSNFTANTFSCPMYVVFPNQ